MQRKRSKNFAEKEKLLLTELILNYKDVIENKRTDGITSKDKEKCWKKIENIYNSTSSTEFRSAEVLKSCWDNLKKMTRKYFADEKMQLYKTGGGPYESRSNVVMERVRDIIKPSVDGIRSIHDSDAAEDNTANSYNEYMNKTSDEVLSDTGDVEEWLHDDINSQDNVLHHVQETTTMDNVSFDDISDVHEATIWDKENNILENYDETDINEDSPVFMNNNQQLSVKKSNIRNVQELQAQNVQDISAVQVLQRKLSTPLQTKTNVLNDQSDSRKRKRPNIPSKKENTITSRISQFDMLTESKIKLAECMTYDFKARHEVEMKILNARLKKEELEIQILKKELLLQENRLRKEQ